MATKSVTGLVTDSLGNPVVGKTVHVLRADTGALLGTSVTSDGIVPPGYTYTHIAGEGSNFTVTGGQTVRYGADVRWIEQTYPVGGTYPCTTGQFGGTDPAYGTAKTCQLVVGKTPPPVGYYKVDTEYTGRCLSVMLSSDEGVNSSVKDWLVPE